MKANYSDSDLMRRYLDILQEREELEETPQEVRREIEKNIQNIPDESDLMDVLKYTKKFGIKGEVAKFSTLKSYHEIVSNVILKAFAYSDLSNEEVKKFLEKLSKDGIIKTDVLLTPAKVHSARDIIENGYEKAFDAVKLPLFQDPSGKIGVKGDVGKGEYLLDILSPKIKRSQPGDLNIAGTAVELKAGQNGRLGPAGSQPLYGRFDEIVPLFNKLMPGKKIPEPGKSLWNIRRTDMPIWTEFFEGDAKKVETALAYMFKMIYPQGIDTQAVANKVVNASGVIDTEQLTKEMLGASFEVYKAAKKFKGIIIMDANVNDFLYVASPEDIKTVASRLQVSFPSWSDTQSNTTKISLIKGSRAAASKGAATKPSTKVKNKPSKVPVGTTSTVAQPGTAPTPAGATTPGTTPSQTPAGAEAVTPPSEVTTGTDKELDQTRLRGPGASVARATKPADFSEETLGRRRKA